MGGEGETVITDGVRRFQYSWGLRLVMSGAAAVLSGRLLLGAADVAAIGDVRGPARFLLLLSALAVARQAVVFWRTRVEVRNEELVLVGAWKVRRVPVSEVKAVHLPAGSSAYVTVGDGAAERVVHLHITTAGRGREPVRELAVALDVPLIEE